MASTLEAILDEASWSLVSSKKELNVHTYLRMGVGGRMDIKVDGVLPRSVSSACAPLLHADLNKTWIPGVSHSVPIIDLSRFRKLIHLKFLKVPLFTQREAVVLGYGDIYSSDSVLGEGGARGGEREGGVGRGGGGWGGCPEAPWRSR